MPVPPIPAREFYQTGAVPQAYDPSWFRTQLGKISRAFWFPISRTVKADTTMKATDDVILCDCTAGAITVTLLPAAQAQFARVTVLKTDASVNAVTLSGTVSGAVNPTLATRYKSITFQSDGTAYYTLAQV